MKGSLKRPPPVPGATRPPFLALLVASGFGTGYAPIASGTVGSAACAILLWFGRGYLGTAPDLLLPVGLAAIGVLASTAVSRAMRVKDPGIIVIDEFAGYAVALALLPKTLPWFVAAFFLFRLMDIWKPPPCRKLEHLPEGFGIVADDVMAGIYANVLLQIARLLT